MVVSLLTGEHNKRRRGPFKIRKTNSGGQRRRKRKRNAARLSAVAIAADTKLPGQLGRARFGNLTSPLELFLSFIEFQDCGGIYYKLALLP